MLDRMKAETLRELLTVGEVAAMLSIHTNTIRRWEAGGLIQAYRVGPRRDRRFLRSDVLHLLQDRPSRAAGKDT